MDSRRGQFVMMLVAVWAGLCSSTSAQLATGRDSIIGNHNPFHSFDPAQPVTVSELCKRLDCIAEELRDDGLVMVKQPDVFSQARLTRFRNDFDTQMSSDLGNFHLVLAARINRLDAATTTSTTALSAALAAPGSTQITQPTTPTFMDTSKLFPTPSATVVDPTKGPFSAIALANQGQGTSTATAAALGLGVDPTVYLDEKKRFLEHLNEIRRISLGPDQNDSSGYGLYLVRLPVSIMPGDCTHQGHGADLSVTVEHEFAPDFLPTTFQNLVINDLVDELGPFIYETIRSGFYEKFLRPMHEARAKKKALTIQTGRELALLMNGLAQEVINAALGRPVRPIFRPPGSPKPTAPAANPLDPIAQPLEEFILRQIKPLTGDPANDLQVQHTLASRLTVLADALMKVKTGIAAIDTEVPALVNQLRGKIEAIRRGDGVDAQLQPEVREAVRLVVRTFVTRPHKPGEDAANANHVTIVDPRSVDMELFRPFMEGLYQTALPEDVKTLDDLLGVPEAQRTAVTSLMAQNNAEINKLEANRFTSLNKLNLPSARTAKQLYPIAPKELLNFFLEENLYLLAKDVQEASRIKEIRGTDVRAYLRHTLEPAYAAMAKSTFRQPEALPPLADDEFLKALSEAIRQREFSDQAMSPLQELDDALIERLEMSRDNIQRKPIAALCWAIAVDAVLLDEALRNDARRVLSAKGAACEPLDDVHFYYPQSIPNEHGKAVFTSYVRHRWPIITFSLDPVTDQQNIADSFNMKRDLQLALSFAFATGQIGFNQLNTFRRQIEQSSDTIALNRTVTAFAHGNDGQGYESFAFRFTPRFQNPPNQRTNIGVIASQLIGGGPGPDYQLKKSKLEPGMRELTAVLLIPTFLPTMRMNVAGNWFKLNDPEHLVFHTKRLMEQGRKVQEIRKAALDICSAQQYRGADLRVLQGKLAQLETMLPMQSKIVQLPFDNIASGFDLLSEGSTALAPELTGYSGVDVIKAPASGAATASAALITPLTPATGVSLTTSTTGPATVTTTTVAGGPRSIADIFVFGKYFSLLDTRVIAGGRSAAFEILSREVVHVQIPANVTPTTTEEDKTYVEVFVSTPNGISNSLLVPYKDDSKRHISSDDAYKLAEKSQSLDVYYQWFTASSGATSLIPTYDPGEKEAIRIAWDDSTGLAPKRLRARFATTINSQHLSFFVQADGGSKGDYEISVHKFIVGLLANIQESNLVVAPAAIPTPLTFKVDVQPFIPSDAENLRVRIEPKRLKTDLKVNMQYSATGYNALQGVAAPDPMTGASLAPRSFAAAKATIAQAVPKNDLAIVRTAQGSTSLPRSFNQPQAPPPLTVPGLLAPNMSSEAEQVGRILTGQPLDARLGRPSPSPLAASTPAGTPAALDGNTTASQLTTAGSSAVQPIVVMPAPVVVLPPKPELKNHGNSRQRSPGFFKNLGNRIGQAFTPSY